MNRVCNWTRVLWWYMGLVHLGGWGEGVKASRAIRLEYSGAAWSHSGCNDLETSITVWLSQQMAACQVLGFDRCCTPATCLSRDSPVTPWCRNVEASHQRMQLFAIRHPRAEQNEKGSQSGRLLCFFNFKRDLTWKVKQNYLRGQNYLRHLTWVAPLVPGMQMRALIWADPSLENARPKQF